MPGVGSVVSVRELVGQCKSARAGFVVGFFAICVALAGCNALSTALDDNRAPDPKHPVPDVIDKVRDIDLLPRFPKETDTAENAAGRTRPIVYNGTTVAPNRGTSNGVEAAAVGDGFELNFENAPVTTVAKVILGDILGLGYTIDSRVQGTVTLSSGRPIPKADVLFVLENALRTSGVVMVRDSSGSGYRLISAADGVGNGNIDRSASAEPGFGISAVPLQHTSAATLMKLVESFAMKPGMVRADTGRNILLLQGNGAERRAAMETVLNFDVDWMRGQSVGVYPVQNSTPEALITELEKILDSGEGGLSQNLVKFQVVGRMNAILVVAKKPELMKVAASWISRLDNSSIAATGVKVYRVRYGEARQMARLLNDVFLGRSASNLDSATNQIAPGSGVSTQSSTERLGLANQSSGFGRPQSMNLGGTQPPALGGSGGDIAQRDRGGIDGASAPGGGPSQGGQSILQNVRIIPDTVNNTLLIYANQESYRLIERTLRQIDRPQLQVAIDATIAEVTLNDTLNYGVQFFLNKRNDGGSVINTIGSAVIERTFPGFNFLVGSANEPKVILDALHSVTGVKVLSTPSIVVVDNQPATLLVGDQVPVSTGTATVLTTNNTVVNTIDYRNTGIILRVVPRINVNGKVLLDIEQEISNVVPGTNATLTPTVSQRKVKSSISVANGQTVLLAGLISETQNKSRGGIPLLDQLPSYLGDAFSHQNNTTARTELIIFIRPKIIQDSVDASFVAEELRSKMKGRIGQVQPAGSPASRALQVRPQPD